MSFAQAAGRRLAVVGTGIVIVSTLILVRMMARSAEREAVAHARTCAAMLAVGGDPLPSIVRMQAADAALLGIGFIDGQGRLETAHPEDESYRAAMVAAAERGAGAYATTAKRNGKSQSAWCVVTPRDGADAKTTERVVVLLSREFDLSGQLGLIVAIALGVAMPLAIGLWSACRWFHRHVREPLLLLTADGKGAGECAPATSANGAGGWRELAEIAEKVSELKVRAAESESRVARIEREAEQRLRSREKGFHRQLRRIRDEATVDPLTNLRNRAFLGKELEGLVSRHRQLKEDMTVVMIDVDNFKHLNDTRGHAAGDELLRFIGELLRATIRPTDFAVRYGGDEFALVLTGVNAAQALAVADRIVKLFAQNAGVMGGAKPPSLSAGVASLAAGLNDDGRALLARADAALYLAKRRGKNSVWSPASA